MITTKKDIRDRHLPLVPERMETIRRLARERSVVRVDDLREVLGVSAATIRRDLEMLESRGEIRRVHGGAVRSKSRLDEPLFDAKTAVAAEEKRRIAEAALRHIGPDETIFLDGGSTVLALARELRERSGLTVVTNSLRAAAELSGQGPRLILVGGELRRLSQTTVGPLTRRLLDEVHVDKAFMGTMGISEKEGLTTTDPAEAFTKELVMQHARDVFLLSDSRKFGLVLFARAGGLDRVGHLITDATPSPAWARVLRRHNVRVHIAGLDRRNASSGRGIGKTRTKRKKGISK